MQQPCLRKLKQIKVPLRFRKTGLRLPQFRISIKANSVLISQDLRASLSSPHHPPVNHPRNWTLLLVMRTTQGIPRMNS
ncbi:unnamed protein product [Brassica oleracea]